MNIILQNLHGIFSVLILISTYTSCRIVDTNREPQDFPNVVDELLNLLDVSKILESMRQHML